MYIPLPFLAQVSKPKTMMNNMTSTDALMSMLTVSMAGNPTDVQQTCPGMFSMLPNGISQQLNNEFKMVFQADISWYSVRQSLCRVFAIDNIDTYVKVLMERALEVANNDYFYQKRFFIINDKFKKGMKADSWGFALGIFEQVPLRASTRSHIVLTFIPGIFTYEWIGVNVWQKPPYTNHLPRDWWNCTMASLVGSDAVLDACVSVNYEQQQSETHQIQEEQPTEQRQKAEESIFNKTKEELIAVVVDTTIYSAEEDEDMMCVPVAVIAKEDEMSDIPLFETFIY